MIVHRESLRLRKSFLHCNYYIYIAEEVALLRKDLDLLFSETYVIALEEIQHTSHYYEIRH